ARMPLIAIGVVIALVAGGWYWLSSGSTRSTENAYVNARVVQVSSLVMGQVIRVPIQENQFVNRNDVLFEIDRRPDEAALAEVEKAKLDLEHTVMRAPEAGVVTRFDLTAGTVVTPGNPLFAIVVDKSEWVDANFKETELGGIRPGLPATVVVDMYPKHEFHG